MNEPWYKDAVIYELHVRSFFDADGDGCGDFRGLTAKLDYLADLGVTALWLLPFYPSPMVDDGYDIADYTGVNPDYGTLKDVRALLRAAHRRGMRVITELVCNHTSDQHPWFQRARRAPAGSPERDYYVWSDTTERYRDARIIFRDVEPSNWTWDPVAGAYYWHRFYSQQPDLNFDSPNVRREVTRAMDFWLRMGVDGLRLDAVPYLYERDGTICENLPETHEFLRQLRAHIDARYEDRLLLAEANQWPEDAVAYFGNGDECHMCFHFPLMPRMFMALRTEDRFPIVDILSQTPPISRTSQWALFLRNHDELTLEMVTDEDRDYMYRVYATDPVMRLNLGIRRRLAPLLGNDRRRMELLYGLLLSLPGTPVLYYGDEIGMGDDLTLGDRDGVRTPMQWNGGLNAGFSTADPARLRLPVITDPEYDYQAVNVEAQQADPHSILWWQKRLIGLRRQSPVFGRGSAEFLQPENRHILAYIREYEGERVLVVANLSRFVQHVELDLSTWAGSIPVEMFSRNDFPAAGPAPYSLTLGPHGFYWFQLMAPTPAAVIGATWEPPVLPPARTLERVLSGRTLSALLDALPEWLASRRWFGAKTRRLRSIQLLDSLPLPEHGELEARLAILKVDYADGEPDLYALPLALADASTAERLVRESPEVVIARLPDGRAVFDGFTDPRVTEQLLGLIERPRRIRATAGVLVPERTGAFRRLAGKVNAPLPATPIRVEQSNTSVVFGERLIFKLFRRLEGGVNPDLEIGRALTERGFPYVPPVAGSLEYRPTKGEPITLGILQGFVPNQGDAWAYTLDAVDEAYERALTLGEEPRSRPPSTRRLLQLARTGLEPDVEQWIGGYLESVRVLGVRTADLHLALGSITDDPAFTPEPFTASYQRSMYQSVRTQLKETAALLARRRELIPEADRPAVDRVLALESSLQERLRALIRPPISGRRIRIHGDYHAGQVLWAGRDFVIIDFEGEPGRRLSERRLKRTPLKDVAGMLRSLHYAAYGPLVSAGLSSPTRQEDVPRLMPWARLWYESAASTFLGSYLRRMGDSDLLPDADDQLVTLLDGLLLQKAFYEVTYELNNRPAWVSIPLRGILELADSLEPARAE